MRNYHLLTVYLATAAAKTVKEYMSDNGDDASAALNAARADVAERERQNTVARRFRSAYEPTIKALGLAVDPENPEEAAEAAAAAVKKIQTAGAAETEKYAGILRDLGIDPTKPDAGVKAVKAKFADAERTGKLEREAAYSKAADALNWDGQKLARQLRDEQGVPELRKVSVKVKDAQGNETTEEREVWGLSRKDDSGKETGFTALTEHENVFPEALAKATPSSTTPAPVVNAMPVITGGKPSAPAPAGGMTFDLGGVGTGQV